MTGRPRPALALAFAFAALPVAACVSIDEAPGEWVAAADITGPLAPEVGPAPPDGAPVAALRVASWNVELGEDPEALAAALAGAAALRAADVVLIQEIEAYPGEAATRAARLAGALGMTWAYAPARAEGEGEGTHGLAILSRLPLEDVRVMRLPFVDQPIRSRARVALAADVRVGERSIAIVNVHLDVRIGAVDRVRQLYPAVAELADQAVVGGDFNSNPWAWLGATIPLTGHEAVVGQDQAAVLDDFMAAFDFAGALAPGVATLRVPVVDTRLDNIYGRGLPVRTGAVATDVGGSDHWPVWADLGP